MHVPRPQPLIFGSRINKLLFLLRWELDCPLRTLRIVAGPSPWSRVFLCPASLLSDWKMEDGGWGRTVNLLVLSWLSWDAFCKSKLCYNWLKSVSSVLWYGNVYWVRTIMLPAVLSLHDQHKKTRLWPKMKATPQPSPGLHAILYSHSTQRHKNIQVCFLWDVLKFLLWAVTHVC